jgi:hypothetical protein
MKLRKQKDFVVRVLLWNPSVRCTLSLSLMRGLWQEEDITITLRDQNLITILTNYGL